MDRRSFIVGSTAAAAALVTRPSLGQDAYPSHAITIINPFPAGGASDVVTRPLAAVLEQMIKQPVVIETKAGAAGQVGAQVAATAKPDGYTLLSHITSISGFAEVDRLFGRQPKFTNADFMPLARFVADPCVIVVNDQQPYKTLKDFVDDVKKRPNEIIFSSSGLYGALHIPIALFAMAAGGLKMRHLPTNGGGPALTALLGNNSQVLASSVSAAIAQIKAGKLRPLASFGGQRSKALPDVPTMKELGYDLEYYLWVGMFAPKAVPGTVVTYLRDALNKAAHTDQYKTSLANLGLDLDYMDQPDFAKFWAEDTKRIEAAVRAIGKVEVTFRTDHIAGGVFIAFGLLVFALSGDLPVGTLSFPGAGMMPKLVASLIILFGLLLVLRASESALLASVRWNDLPHAARVTAIAAAAIALYQTLGFIVTMTLLLFALTSGAERRNPLYASAYSVGVVLLTYMLFAVALKTPLDHGIIPGF